MIKVDFGALGGGKSAQVFVIRVVLEKSNSGWSYPLENFLRDGCFPRTRSTCDADDSGAVLWTRGSGCFMLELYTHAKRENPSPAERGRGVGSEEKVTCLP